eukprot:scaffold4454_cov411-Prasinococcus_capsulatus_cf.AAC.15
MISVPCGLRSQKSSEDKEQILERRRPPHEKRTVASQSPKSATAATLPVSSRIGTPLQCVRVRMATNHPPAKPSCSEPNRNNWLAAELVR